VHRLRLALFFGLVVLLSAGTVAAAASPGEHVYSNGSRASGRVALTFDDGVSPANCRRILATLVSRGIPATFFPIGEAMRADPAFWRTVVAEGDPIGDHTLTHPEMPTLTEAQQFAQIDKARRLAAADCRTDPRRACAPAARAVRRRGGGAVWDRVDDVPAGAALAHAVAVSAAERIRRGLVRAAIIGPVDRRERGSGRSVRQPDPRRVAPAVGRLHPAGCGGFASASGVDAALSRCGRLER
jgi:peptidoglycan/xylan/chitin deacetylase (PgdA/CDA1 family)